MKQSPNIMVFDLKCEFFHQDLESEDANLQL